MEQVDQKQNSRHGLGENQETSLKLGDAAIQVIAEEHHPANSRRNLAEVNPGISSVKKNPQEGSRGSVQGIGQGVHQAIDEREEHSALQGLVFCSAITETPEVSRQQDQQQQNAQQVGHDNAGQIKGGDIFHTFKTSRFR